jgi:ELWxxDGT repeat protein
LLLAAVFALVTLAPAGAQTAALVADLHHGPPAPGQAPPPQTFMPLPGGSAFFLPGATPEAAQILWATDGTDAGTRSLGSFLFPRFLGTLPGLAFFLAGSPDETNSLYRLWRTDGTDAGTFPVSEAGSFALQTSVVVRGRLLTSFCDQETNDCGLYASDGSAAGTIRLAHGSFGEAATLMGSVFLLSDSGTLLWRTDGTPEGTRAVRRLRPGWTRLLSAAGSRLFYMSGEDSGELWTSDGTSRGTVLVRTFLESGHDFLPRNTTFLKPTGDGQVTFVAARGGSFLADLWRSDGTRRGTVRLTSFQERSGFGLNAGQISVLGQRTLFVVDNGVSGPRLWSTRGSLGTTAPLAGCPGGCPELLAGTPLFPVGKRVIFAARDEDHGAELWTSDGTGAGTRLVADLCPGPCDSGPADFTAAAGRIWFRITLDGTDHLARTDGTAAGSIVLAAIPTAFDLDLAADATQSRRVFFAGMDTLDGAQLWVTDGTPAGTARVSVLPAPAASSEPANFTALSDQLLFTAWDGAQTALWVTGASGTGASIVPGTAVPGKAGPTNVTVAGGRAFFVQDRGDGTAAQLWRTDGTAAGTVAAFPDRTLSDLHDFGGRILFLATPTGDAERHIPSAWASDGTAAGTVQLFSPPDDTLNVLGLSVLGAEIYFEADRESGSDIFRSDGTAAGTRSILKFICCTFIKPQFVRLGDAVYFTAFGELYRTDGTAAGTAKALGRDAFDNPLVISPSFPFLLGGRLFLFGSTLDGTDFKPGLFRIDGDQPSLIAPVSELGGSDPQLTPLGGVLYFRAWDVDHGTELWRTDGTPQGTVLVTDLVPGPGSSDPQSLTAAGGLLYFSAWDQHHGRELWASDGTAAGTRLVDDIAPGAFSSAPMLLTPVAGRLFFTADDGLTGREPWSLALPPSSPSP